MKWIRCLCDELAPVLRSYVSNSVLKARWFISAVSWEGKRECLAPHVCHLNEIIFSFWTLAGEFKSTNKGFSCSVTAITTSWASAEKTHRPALDQNQPGAFLWRVCVRFYFDTANVYGIYTEISSESSVYLLISTTASAKHTHTHFPLTQGYNSTLKLKYLIIT